MHDRIEQLWDRRIEGSGREAGQAEVPWRPGRDEMEHGINRFEAVLGQAQKLLHSVLRNAKRYDLRRNTERERLYPYQPALDTINQLWKYKIMYDELGILPDGLASLDDVSDEVMRLPFAAEILTGPYEMSVAPKENAAVRAIPFPGQIPGSYIARDCVLTTSVLQRLSRLEIDAPEIDPGAVVGAKVHCAREECGRRV